MAQVDILDASNYQGSRQSCIFEPPEYELTRAQDHTLQWNPPPDSEELAIALSWHFPMEKNILGKMQAAIKRFLQLERKKSAPHVTHKAEPALREMGSFRQPLAEQNSHHAQPSKPPARISPMNRSQDTVLSQQTIASRLNRVVKPKVQTWDGKMRELKPKRKKRTYGQDEAAKVARNRGSTCEDHRRLKIKCDPATCPQNKQNLSATSSSEMVISNSPGTNPLASWTSSSFPSMEIPPNLEIETSSCMPSSTELPSSLTSGASNSADSACFVSTSDSEREIVSGMTWQINPTPNFKEIEPASIPARNRVTNMDFELFLLKTPMFSMSIPHDACDNSNLNAMDIDSSWLNEGFVFGDESYFDDAIEPLGECAVNAYQNVLGDVHALDEQKKSLNLPPSPFASNPPQQLPTSTHRGGRSRIGIDDSRASYFSTIGMSDRKIVGHYSRFQKLSLNDDMPVASYEIERYCLHDSLGNQFRCARTRSIQNYSSRADFGRAIHRLPQGPANMKRVRGVRFHTAEAFGVVTGGGNWGGEFGKLE